MLAGLEKRVPSSAAVEVVEMTQAVGVPVQQGDVGAHAHRQPGRVGPHHAAAQDHHPGGRHTGHAGQQHAAAPMLHLQGAHAGLDGQAPGDLRHGGEQGGALAGVEHRFERDGVHVAGHQRPGQIRRGGQMQVAEQPLPGAQALDLRRLGLLDLEDQIRRVHLGGVGRGGSGSPVGLVVEADRAPRVPLHHHLVAGGDHAGHAGGRGGDAEFVILDFPGNADAHGGLLRGFRPPALPRIPSPAPVPGR
jgi:hypothetical protein